MAGCYPCCGFRRNALKGIQDIVVDPEPEAMPLKRLCGRCPSLSAKEVGAVFPNRVHRKMRPPRKDVLDSKEDWWEDDVENIQLLPPPPTSAFSRRPHPQFKHLACWEVTRVEARVLQNVKA